MKFWHAFLILIVSFAVLIVGCQLGDLFPDYALKYGSIFFGIMFASVIGIGVGLLGLSR